MSKRAGGGRGRGKQAAAAKDELAKAAAEVLNNITTIGKQVSSAQQDLSGGQPRGSPGLDTGADVIGRQAQGQHVDQTAQLPPPQTTQKAPFAAALTDQQQEQEEASPQHSPPALASLLPGGVIARSPGVGPGAGAGSVHLPPPIPGTSGYAVGGGGTLLSPRAFAMRAAPGSAQVRLLQLQQQQQMLQLQQQQHQLLLQQQQQQQRLQPETGQVVGQLLPQAADPAQAPEQGQEEAGPDVGQGADGVAFADGDAPAPDGSAAADSAASHLLHTLRSFLSRGLHVLAGNTTTAAAAAAAAVILSLLAVLLLRSGTDRAAITQLAMSQGAMQQEFGALRAEAAEGERRAAALVAAAVGELRQELGSAAAAATARQEAALAALGRQLAATRDDVTEQAAELRAVRQAVEQVDAVRSIGMAEAAAKPPHDPAGQELVPPPPGWELRGLPPCDARRMAALAGPLLPARVVSHSAVLGDNEAVMRFHAAASALFRARSDPRVHPIARGVTSPNAVPACLPLVVADTGAASGGGGGGGGGDGADVYGSVELELRTPSHVAAISFRYPPEGTWDTSSALSLVSVTLHEAPAGAGGAGTAGGGRAGAAPRLRARHVELAPLKGMECQHVEVPQREPPAEGPLLVHRVTLHVRRNFGSAQYACVPRVLLRCPLPS